MLTNQPIPENFLHCKDLNLIITKALESVDPEKCVKKVIERKSDSMVLDKYEYKLKDIHKVYVVGVGKAVLPMAFAISETLNDLLAEGILISKHEDHDIQLRLNKKLRVLKGSHPIPDLLSIEATEKMLDMLKKTIPHDLVIGLISGGGSALLTYPVEEIGLAGVQSITSLLLKCGATIEEMNTIRKHLDKIKGGGLLKQIYPSKSVNLILSDVLGDPLSMIASGPTCADPTTFSDCIKIFQKYGIEKQVDSNVMEYLKNGVLGLHEETIKEGDPIIRDHKNVIVGSLSIAAEAAHQQAVKSGFVTKILTTSLRGEARVAGLDLANRLVDLVKYKKINNKPVCMIAGGETTVTVTGKGKGGRNQELVLAAAQVLEGIENCAFISFATDGEDGPTDAAGGIVTGETINKGYVANLDPGDFLRNNNAYEYLNSVGGLIRTGPTGTNVNDLVLMFAF